MRADSESVARDRIVESSRFQGWWERLASQGDDHLAWRATMALIAAEVAEWVGHEPDARGDAKRLTTQVMEALARLVPPPAEFPWIDCPEPPPSSEAELFEMVVYGFPNPIAAPYEHFANQPFMGTLLDTFEAFLHYLAVVALSGYLRDGAFHPAHNKRLLDLLRPQAQWGPGRLLEILRDTVALYRRHPEDLAYPELYAYLFTCGGGHTESLTSLAEFVRVRNDEWGHKGGRDEASLRSIVPGQRQALERELNRCRWLAGQSLVVPSEIDPEGNITRARTIMGLAVRPAQPFGCQPGGRGGSLVGLEGSPERTVVLCTPDRKGYLPLFPFSVFYSGRGTYFLNSLQWKKQAERVKLATFLKYHGSHDSQHEEQDGEVTTRAIEGKVDHLKAHLGHAAAQVEARSEGHAERVVFDLPEVAGHRGALLESFVGREDVLAHVLARVGLPRPSRSDLRPRAVLVVGGEGQGKSALVCKVTERLGEAGVPCLHHMVSCHHEPRRFLQFLLGTGLRLLQETPDPDLLRSDADELRNALVDVLDRLGRISGGVLLAMDGLDGLDERDRRLAFLPAHLPSTCTLLLSTRPHDGIVATLRGLHPHLDCIELAGMPLHDVRLFAEKRLGLPAGSTVGIHEMVDLDDLLAGSDGCPFLLEHHLAACQREMEKLDRHHVPPVPIRIHDLPGTTGAWFEDRYRELAEKGPGGYATRNGRVKARLLHLLALAREPLAPEDLAALLSRAGLPGVDPGSAPEAARRWPLALEEVRDLLASMASWLHADPSGRLRLGQASFAGHIRARTLGATDAAALHGAFSQWLDEPAQALRPYRIRHHAAHVLHWAHSAPVVAGARLESLLQDFAYLQARVEAHEIFELLRDFEEARKKCSAPGVVAWHRFVDRHSHELARDPRRFHQAALDLPADDPVARTADAVPPMAPLLRRVNRPRREEAGTFLRAVGGHGHPVTAVAVSRDGHVAASGDAMGVVRLWEVSTGRDKIALPLVTEAVGALAFSEDGRTLAAGTDDGRVHLWRVSDGTALVSAFDAHASPVRGLHFIEGPRLLLSMDQRGGARLWDLETGTRLADLPPACDTAVTFAWGGGQGTLACAEHDTLRLETCASRVFLPRHPWMAVASEERLAVFRDDDDEIGICALDPFSERGTLPAPPSRMLRVAVDDDGGLAITAHEDGTLRTWDLHSRREMACLRAHRGPVLDVALDATAKCALSAGEDATVRVWDLSRRPDGAGLRPHGAPVIRSWVAPGGSLVVTLAADGSAHAWDPRCGDHCGRLLEPGALVTGTAVCWTPMRLATGTSDGAVTVLDMVSRNPAAPSSGEPPAVGAAVSAAVLARSAAPASVGCFAFARDGNRWFVGAADGSVAGWSLGGAGQATSDFLVRLSPAVAHSLAVAPGNDLLVVGCSDGVLRILSVATGEETARLAGHDDAIRDVVVTANGTVVSASDDGTIRAWSLAERRPWHVFDTGVVHRPLAMAVGPNGRSVAAGCADNVLRAWNLETGLRLWEGVGHESDILAVAWSSDRKRIVTGGADGTCRAWDARTGRALAFYQARADVRACAVGGDVVACGDDAGSVCLLRLEGAECVSGPPVQHTPATLREASLRAAPPVLKLTSHGSKRRVEGIRLDYHQNRVLKKMKGGTFLIEGMPGSGKTLVLLQYAILTARHQVPPRRVLFVCYNLALSRCVEDLLGMNVEAKVRERITVRAFYDLCGCLAGRPVDHAVPRREYYAALLADAQRSAAALADEERFDAILVDEGQDLSDEMFGLLVMLRRKGSRDFKVAEDGTQNLFCHRPPGSDHSWGHGKWALEIARTHRERLYASHRSSQPIMEHAYSLLGRRPPRPEDTRPDEPQLPFHVGREGTAPDERCLSVPAMIRFLVGDVKEHLKKDSAAEIGILYTRDLDADQGDVQALALRIVEDFRRQGIAMDFFSENPQAKLSFRLEAPTVKLGSVHAAKGLDFKIVYLLDLVASPDGAGTPARGRALDPKVATTLFVGATRARDLLHVITTTMGGAS